MRRRVMGDDEKQRNRRIMEEEIERLKREEKGVRPIGVDRRWTAQIDCPCGGKAQLISERFSTSAEYRCETCGESIINMICGDGS